MARYTNNWTPGIWEGVGPVLPTAAQDAMSYYQQLLLMVKLINETRENCDNLADFVNDQLEAIVEYLNERIEDFNKSMNTFFENVQAALDEFKADYEKFKSDMLAAFEQFKSDILARQEEFERRIDEKIAALEGEWEDMKEEWQTIKSEWEALKQEWQTFKEELLQSFDDFKAEMKRLWEEYKSQTNESLEDWKEETFNYFLGQYETIKQLLISQLPEVVQQYLPDALKQIAGVAVKYNEETRKLDVNYGPGLAVDDQNRLIPVGGSGGGDSIEAGKGIDLQDNPETSKKTVSVKLAADGGLEFDDDGALRSTGGSGGDTIVAGEGIKVEGEGTKTVQSAPATSQTLGGVKTGNSDETGLVVGEDGTISIKKWSPIDITKDFEFFDSNLQNVAPLWTLDGQYSPNGRQFTLYGRMQESAIETIGIPQNATIVWNPDSVWEYDTRPIAGAIQTNSLIQNATFSVRIDLPDSGARNGSGEIQFSWKGKENVSKLQFKVVKADLDLDEQTPVVIAGTPIGEGGSITFENLDMKSIGFKMKDGTIVSDLQKIKSDGSAASMLGIEAQNFNCALQGALTPRLQAKNLVDGPVSLKIKRSAFGIQTDQTLSSLININVNFQNSVWDGVKLVCQASDNTIDNFTTNNTLQFLFPGYSGQNASDFEITQDDGEVVGIGALGRAQSNMNAGNQITLFAGRFGTVTLTLRTRTYTTTFTKTITITVRETDNVPHIKLTTNQTSVGDQALDIANPETVEIRDISKAQGIVTFWAQAYPSKNYVYRYDAINITVKLNNVVVWSFQIRGDTDLNNNQFAVDLTSHAVGELFTIEYNATRFEQPVNITFGKVVD